MAEDVPENHVVSEDVGMLTGVTEFSDEVGTNLMRKKYALGKGNLVKVESDIS